MVGDVNDRNEGLDNMLLNLTAVIKHQRVDILPKQVGAGLQVELQLQLQLPATGWRPEAAEPGPAHRPLRAPPR
jgi:hypothetical protein